MGGVTSTMKRNKSLKRFLAFLLCAAMMITYMPSSVYTLADEETGAAAVTEETAPAPAPAETNEPAPAPDPEPAAEEPAQDDVAAPEADETSPADAEPADEVTEEPAEDPEEELIEEDAEDEEGLNEETLTFNGKANSVSVKVTAEPGTFPEGTTMKVTKVAKADVEDAVEAAMGEEVRDFRAVDITFYADGKEVQPKKDVSVKLTTSAFDTDENLSVVHVEDPDKNKVEVMDLTKSSDTMAQFSTDGFSIYVVVDGGEVLVEQRTYHFVNEVVNGSADAYFFLNKAGESVDNQIIKEGDELEDVGTPRLVNKTFLGWYLLDGTNGTFTYTDTQVTFETPITGVDATEDVYVAPKYEAVYYVTFHENAEDSGEDDVIQTKKVVYTSGSNANKVLISDVIAPQPDESHIFYGWKLDDTKYSIYDESGQIKETYIENITDNEDVYPDFEKAYWLRFVSAEHGANATYIESMFVLEDEAVSTLPVPTRQGYVFEGWYKGSQEGDVITYTDQVTDASGNVTISGGLKLTEDLTVYGKWTPDTGTTYNVVFWLQKVTDDKDAADEDKTYDYWDSEVRNGATGSEAAATDADKTRTETGFHYSRYSTTSTTIEADGSTTVNVYYDRDLVSVNFYYRNQVPGSEGAYIYTPTTSDSETPQQYGVLPDGTYVPIHKYQSSLYIEIYYTYTSWGRTYRYTGTFYTRSGSVFNRVYTATEYNGDNLPPNNGVTYYGLTGEDWFGNPEYSELTRREEQHAETGWAYTQDGQEVPYYGTRYHRENAGGQYGYMITFTGLYGQGFDMYDYEWPADFRWNEQSDGDGMTQTFMNDFTNSSSAYNLYEQGSNGSNLIIHYKQNADGKYSEENSYVAKTTSTSLKFNFSDKFDGYDVVSYSSSFNPDGGNHPVSDGDSVSGLSTPLHIYHARETHNLTYKVGNEESDPVSVKFGASLEDRNVSLADAGFEEREHYVFTGWYADETCTSPFDFTSTMPNSNIVVYAGFDKETYDVSIDPAGGVITSEIGATFFTADYNEKITKYNGVKREYIEDPNGDYKYVINFSLEARTATYELIDPGEDYEGTRYRPMTSADPTYTLVGWYEVIDGNMSAEPYDFDAPVTKDTMIRAKWKLSGGYTLQYTAVSTVTVDGQEVEVGGTFTQTEPNALYADLSETVVQATPTNVTQGFVFDGWEVVADDATGTTLDDNDGNYYQTGDKLTIHAAWANSNKQIHIRAHYTALEDSDIPVSVTEIYYNVNPGHATFESGTTPEGWTITVEESGNARISGIQINKKFNLLGADDFVSNNPDEYELIGWTTHPDGDEVVFECGQEVAADNLGRKNTLYPVWRQKTATVTVHHYLRGTETKVADDVTESKTIGDTYTATPVTTYLGKELTVDEEASDQYQNVEVIAGGVVINIYYTLALTITAADGSKIYDGTPLLGNFTEVSGALTQDITKVNNAIGAVFPEQPSITDAGELTYPNAEQQAAITAGIPSYYEVEYTTGTLTVDRRHVQVVINGNTDTVPYTGSPQSVTGYTVEITVDNSDGKTFDSSNFDVYYRGGDAAKTATRTELGQTDMTMVPDMFDLILSETGEAAGLDIGNFIMDFATDFTLNNGWINITEAEMTLTATPYSGQYDGQTHNGGATCSAEGATITYSVYDTATETWGEYTDTVPSIKNVGKVTYKAKAVLANYKTVESEPADLEVTFVTVRVIPDDKNKVYGEEDPELTATIEGLVNGESEDLISYELTREEGEDVGTYVISGDARKSQGNYKVQVGTGTFTITEATMTLTATDYEGTYDASAHGITVSAIDGATVYYSTVDPASSGFDPETGWSTTAPTFMDVMTDVDGNVLSATVYVKAEKANYTTATASATVTINPVELTVTITGHNNQADPVTYDNQSHTVTGYDVTIGSGNIDLQLSDMYRYWFTTSSTHGNITRHTEPLDTNKDNVSVSGTDAGTYPMGLTGENTGFECSNPNYNVTFNVTDGWLKIDKAKLMITVKDQTYTYNSTPQGEEGGDYNGEANVLEKVDVEGLQGGDKLIRIRLIQAKEINADTYTDAIKADHSQAVFTTLAHGDIKQLAEKNYDVEYIDGDLIINKRPITITFTGTTKNETYDGTPKTNDEYSTQISDRAYKAEWFGFKREPVIKETNAGNYAMELVPGDLVDNSADFHDGAQNFEVTFVIAHDMELNIAKRTATINVTMEKAQSAYNGEEQSRLLEFNIETDDDVLSSMAGYPPAYNVKQDYRVHGKDVGFYNSNVSTDLDKWLKEEEPEAKEILDNFDLTINVEQGSLEITPAPLTITTGSDSKTYDGTALTNADASIDGLVNDETATITATGSQTAVGSSKNGYEITWGTAKETNYEIVEENLGTLTVNAAGGGGDNPGGGGGNPGGGGVNPPGPDNPEVIPDEPTPTVEPEVIPDEPTPLALTWAVANLVMAVITALGAIIALFRKKEEDDDEFGDDNRGKKMLAAKIAGALAGIAAPITFFLTEDMANVPVAFDKYTALMAGILAVQVIAAVFNRAASKASNVEDGAEDAAN